MLVNVFAPEFRDQKHIHLKNFFMIIPPLVSVYVVYSSPIIMFVVWYLRFGENLMRCQCRLSIGTNVVAIFGTHIGMFSCWFGSFSIEFNLVQNNLILLLKTNWFFSLMCRSSVFHVFMLLHSKLYLTKKLICIGVNCISLCIYRLWISLRIQSAAKRRWLRRTNRMLRLLMTGLQWVSAQRQKL